MIIVLTFLLQDYKEKLDYSRCVAIVATASLREMIKPGALAILSPTIVGGLAALILILAYVLFFCQHYSLG